MDNYLNNDNSEFLFYVGSDGTIKVQVIVGDETVWATQNSMSEIFGVESHTINYHLKEIYKSSELQELGTTRKIRVVQKEGGRDVGRNIDFYNLDVIIAVGYRVNSYQATQFRIWATKVLKEYLIKGFALDDDRLKQGGNLFGKDYFSELLERIREIRASERRFYQKITDLYATAIDYDKNSPITHEFYATVQNKLHWAIHHSTAAELIRSRSDADKPNMGLTTWKNAKDDGKILKSDVSVAKNYLTEEELSELNRIVSMYLDFAENMAARKKEMKMVDWVQRLDSFLDFNEYDVLKNSGRITAKLAKEFAERQYEKFRVIQDREFKSDFDKVVSKIKETGKLPESKTSKMEIPKIDLTSFDDKLKHALKFNPKGKGE